MSEFYRPASNSEKAALEVLLCAAVKAVLDKHEKEEMTVDKEIAIDLEREINALLPDGVRAFAPYDNDSSSAYPMIVAESPEAFGNKMRAVGRWLADSFRWSIENEGWE